MSTERTYMFGDDLDTKKGDHEYPSHLYYNLNKIVMDMYYRWVFYYPYIFLSSNYQ
jgi:hypothetical protein